MLLGAKVHLEYIPFEAVSSWGYGVTAGHTDTNVLPKTSGQKDWLIRDLTEIQLYFCNIKTEDGLCLNKFCEAFIYTCTLNE